MPGGPGRGRAGGPQLIGRVLTDNPSDQPLGDVIAVAAAVRPAGGVTAAGVARAMRSWWRNYVLAPRYRRAERLRLVASDGTRLSAARIQGPPDAPLTVVLIHGFVNWSRTPPIYALARRLARQVNVVIPDLRGHGRSGGRCTMGRDEPMDVAAGVAAAPPGLPVVTIGLSLGGAAVLLHAGTCGGVAGSVAISGPAWWGVYDREGSGRVQRWISRPSGRAVLACLLRTRVVANCQGVPKSDRVVKAISPAFVLVAHDPDDSYFGPEHAQQIYDWAEEPRELWWVPGAGHGTDVLTPAFNERLLAAILAKVAAAPGARAPGGAVSGPPVTGPPAPSPRPVDREARPRLASAREGMAEVETASLPFFGK